MLYVSYHSKPNVDAIGASSYLPNVLGAVQSPGDLNELRGLAIGPDRLLWVVSGGKKSSQVLRFQPEADANGQHEFVDVLAAAKNGQGPHGPWLVLDGMVHPFDVAFASDGSTWFISCQDTNLVLGQLPVGPPYTPNPPISQFLASLGGSFPPGSFVGSTRVDLPEAPKDETTKVAPPAGLGVKPSKGKPEHSVRGLADDGKILYVADEASNKVKAYDDSTGKFLWYWPPDGSTSSLASPVHLLYDSGLLYVGNSGSGTDSVLCIDLSDGSATVVASNISKVSAVALDPDGNLYVGSRAVKSNGKWCVYQVPKGSTTPTQFGQDLDDAPEFLLYVPDPG